MLNKETSLILTLLPFLCDLPFLSLLEIAILKNTSNIVQEKSEESKQTKKTLPIFFILLICEIELTTTNRGELGANLE